MCTGKTNHAVPASIIGIVRVFHVVGFWSVLYQRVLVSFVPKKSDLRRPSFHYRSQTPTGVCQQVSCWSSVIGGAPQHWPVQPERHVRDCPEVLSLAPGDRPSPSTFSLKSNSCLLMEVHTLYTDRYFRPPTICHFFVVENVGMRYFKTKVSFRSYLSVLAITFCYVRLAWNFVAFATWVLTSVVKRETSWIPILSHKTTLSSTAWDTQTTLIIPEITTWFVCLSTSPDHI